MHTRTGALAYYYIIEIYKKCFKNKKCKRNEKIHQYVFRRSVRSHTVKPYLLKNMRHSYILSAGLIGRCSRAGGIPLQRFTLLQWVCTVDLQRSYDIIHLKTWKLKYYVKIGTPCSETSNESGNNLRDRISSGKQRVNKILQNSKCIAIVFVNMTLWAVSIFIF